MEKYYDLKEVTPKEMVEDFFLSEANETLKAQLDDGWKIGMVITKDTTDEEIRAMAEKMAAEME